MEKQPWQAFETNVLGTLRTAGSDCSGQRTVRCSTDKAVNPTSVMRCASAAELLVLHESSRAEIHCVITRFGNVLGSNGSVIPLFLNKLNVAVPSR